MNRQICKLIIYSLFFIFISCAKFNEYIGPPIDLELNACNDCSLYRIDLTDGGTHKYQKTGDRCEGNYHQQVSSNLQVVGVFKGNIKGSDTSINISLIPDYPTKAVNIRALSASQSKITHQMNLCAARFINASSYNWSLQYAKLNSITNNEIFLFGWIHEKRYLELPQSFNSISKEDTVIYVPVIINNESGDTTKLYINTQDKGRISLFRYTIYSTEGEVLGGNSIPSKENNLFSIPIVVDKIHSLIKVDILMIIDNVPLQISPRILLSKKNE